MKTLTQIGIAFVLAGCLLGCNKTKPQAPANRKTEVDSTQMAMMLLTQRLVDEAITEVNSYILTLDSAYVQTPSGCWVRHVTKQEGDTLTKGQHVRLHSIVSTLKGETLIDAENAIQVGSNEVVNAVDDVLLNCRYGERVSIIAPWMSAFGAAGNERVPGYTNVRIELEIYEN